MFYSGNTVKQIDVPSMSGAFGILPSHVPTMAALSPGVVTVYESDGAINKYFVSSGTVTVNSDATVQVLAEEACILADIDVSFMLQWDRCVVIFHTHGYFMLTYCLVSTCDYPPSQGWQKSQKFEKSQ